MSESMITNSLSSNSIMDSKDGLIDDTNAQVADEKPIFILKKKWYITDLRTKLLCLFMLLGFWNIPSDIVANQNSTTIVIIGAYLGFYMPIIGFLFSLAQDVTRSIYCYKNHIYIRGLFFLFST